MVKNEFLLVSVFLVVVFMCDMVKVFFEILIYYQDLLARSLKFQTTVVATYELPFGGLYPYIIVLLKIERQNCLTTYVIDDFFPETIFHSIFVVESMRK